MYEQSTTTTPITGDEHTCPGCGKPITERYLLKTMNTFWHEDCLKCSCCDCRLGEVGASLFSKANLLLCRRDYLRLFGTTGYCGICSKVIPAFEMVMRAKGNVYHLECFACQQCNHRFCVGDKYFMVENRILCEYDYEESVGGYLPPPPPPPVAPLEEHRLATINPTAVMDGKVSTGQACHLDVELSSGYGSPSPQST